MQQNIHWLLMLRTNDIITVNVFSYITQCRQKYLNKVQITAVGVRS